MRRGVVVSALVCAAIVAAGCADPVLSPAPADTRVAVFDQVWHDFDLNYSFFALDHVDWDSARAMNRPPAAAAPSDAVLAQVIGNMLLGLHDRHVSLTTPGRTIVYESASDRAPSLYDPLLIEEHYLTGGGVTSGGHVRYGWLSPTVAYLRIPSFDGSADWSGEMDKALAALSGARALVVDVRDNLGGLIEIATAAAGRFAGVSRTFGYVRLRNGPKHTDFTDFIPENIGPSGAKQFTGPVYVITDRKVYSAAEDFVLAARSLPNVTVLGDTTAGASGRPLVRELPNGWTFALSTWIEYTADKRVFEDVGLAPTVYVPERPTVVSGAATGPASVSDDRALDAALALASTVR